MQNNENETLEIADILVIGGGINGASIARDAAGRGLNVVLCEKDDLAQHTSSSSTKLSHGGLRYLEHYDFLLVRHSLQERKVISINIKRTQARGKLFKKSIYSELTVDDL